MIRVRRWVLPVFVLGVTALAGCGEFGQVEQGLVVAYDGQAVTVLLDTNHEDPNNPRYDKTPPIRVRIPADAHQMGPEPAAGGLVSLDTEAGVAVVYDAAAQQLETIQFELIEKTDGVFPDDARVAAPGVPRVDAAAGTVTLYSPRSRQLATIKVPEKYLSWPQETWQQGDEVRYYFKDPNQALRMMNVSRTKVS